MKFAKIFERGDQQVLVHLDNNDAKDGDPCIRIKFSLNDWTFAELIPIFEGSDVDDSHCRARKTFEELTEAKAFEIVDKLRDDFHRNYLGVPS